MPLCSLPSSCSRRGHRRREEVLLQHLPPLLILLILLSHLGLLRLRRRVHTHRQHQGGLLCRLDHQGSPRSRGGPRRLALHRRSRRRLRGLPPLLCLHGLRRRVRHRRRRVHLRRGQSRLCHGHRPLTRRPQCHRARHRRHGRHRRPRDLPVLLRPSARHHCQHGRRHHHHSHPAHRRRLLA